MKITNHASVVAETVQKILDVTITWKIEAAGMIDADIAVTKDDEFPDLPRFGVRMFLDKKLSAVRYFGMGPQESYCDKQYDRGIAGKTWCEDYKPCFRCGRDSTEDS